MHSKPENLQILIPVGGIGERFQSKGFKTPKPLILAKDKPMILWAIESAKKLFEPNAIILSVREKNQQTQLKKVLDHQKIEFSFVGFDEATAGAVETCLKARDLINETLPLLIVDCDIAFSSPILKKCLTENKIDFDAFITTFDSHDSRYSYIETKGNQVVRTAEKEVISNMAIVGAYFFTKAKTFLESASRVIEHGIGENREFYLSLVFNQLILEGKNVKHGPGSFVSFGTPEELATFNMSFTEEEHF